MLQIHAVTASYWHCPHSTTVRCPSDRRSVRLSHPAAHAPVAGLLLWAPRAGDIDRQRRAPSSNAAEMTYIVSSGALNSTPTNSRRSTALSSTCGQCHVDSRVDEAEHRLYIVYTAPLTGRPMAHGHHKTTTSLFSVYACATTERIYHCLDVLLVMRPKRKKKVKVARTRLPSVGFRS